MEKKLKILVVDDDRNAIETLSDLLAEYGYEVTGIEDGSKAIFEIENIGPDIVLLDTRLPGMDGYTLCEKMRAKVGKSVKIILYTAYADLVNVARAKASGADEYISKSEEFSNIIRTINSLTDQFQCEEKNGRKKR